MDWFIDENFSDISYRDISIPSDLSSFRSSFSNQNNEQIREVLEKLDQTVDSQSYAEKSNFISQLQKYQLVSVNSSELSNLSYLIFLLAINPKYKSN